MRNIGKPGVGLTAEDITIALPVVAGLGIAVPGVDNRPAGVSWRTQAGLEAQFLVRKDACQVHNVGPANRSARVALRFHPAGTPRGCWR